MPLIVLTPEQVEQQKREGYTFTPAVNPVTAAYYRRDVEDALALRNADLGRRVYEAPKMFVNLSPVVIDGDGD